jgi:hypothetical protein
MRIMLHGRMAYGMERYAREHPEVDILLIQPTRDDVRMFGYNIMRTSARRVVAEHGYRTTLAFFRRSAVRHRRLFAKHGIALANPRGIREPPSLRPQRTRLGRALDVALDRLEAKLRVAGSAGRTSEPRSRRASDMGGRSRFRKRRSTPPPTTNPARNAAGVASRTRPSAAAPGGRRSSAAAWRARSPRRG